MTGFLKQAWSGLTGASRFRIFLSYRRHGEGAGYAGRVADRLIQEFGQDQVFRDIDDIESGVDFVRAIEEAVGSCEALIAVMGPDWIDVRNAAGHRRLDDPNDFVRLEVGAALSRNVRVIPVLVGGAGMPGAEELPGPLQGLSRRQAVELTDTRWEFDVGQLVSAIERMGIRRRAKRKSPLATHGWKIAGAAAAITVLALMAAQLDNRGSTDGNVGANTLYDQPAANPAPVAMDPGTADRSAPVQPTSAAEQPVNDPPVDHAARDRADVVASLRAALDAQLQALHALNPYGLENHFTGAALVQTQQVIAGLMAQGAHLAATYTDYRILAVDLQGDQATVAVQESWNGQMHQNGTDICLGTFPQHSSRGLRYLVREQGTWKVAVFGPDDFTPALVPGC